MAFSNEDILVLAKAGFNAQQIAALNSVAAAPAPNTSLQVGAEQPLSTPNPAQVETQTATAPTLSNTVNEATAIVNAPTPAVNNMLPPAPAPAPAAPAATINDVLQSINGLSQQIQLGNLQNAQQPKPVTAEDILAEIINPPMKTNK